MKAQKSTKPKPSKSFPQSGHGSHTPQNVLATDAIPRLHQSAGRLHPRLTRKIARLASDTQMRPSPPCSARPKEVQKLPQMPVLNPPNSSAYFAVNCIYLQPLAAICTFNFFNQE